LNSEKQIQNLLLRCIDGDVKAQKHLYDLYIDRLYHTTQRITNNRHNTEDVLQQAFVKIFQKLETYKPESGNVFSWLCRICINEAISQRRKKKFHFVEVNEEMPIIDSRSNMLEEMSIDYIADAIMKLPELYRIIFTLYEIEGYTHREIANQLKIGVPTSRSYLSRAKSKLQDHLSELKYNVG